MAAPFRFTSAGSVIAWFGPAFTCGGWLVTITGGLTVMVTLRCALWFCPSVAVTVAR